MENQNQKMMIMKDSKKNEKAQVQSKEIEKIKNTSDKILKSLISKSIDNLKK